MRIEATQLTCTVRAVSLEPFRAVTLVGTWSVGAVGVGVTRFLSLAFVDIWNSDAPTNGHTYSLLVRHVSVCHSFHV